MQGRNRVVNVEKIDVWTQSRSGEVREMNWKIRIDIYTLPCAKQIASGKPLYSTGCSAQCSVMT